MEKPLSHDIEVALKDSPTKAVIEGKTSVPFKRFVQLILQRKVLPLFKDWGDEPVILSSELLTTIASASQESQENRAHFAAVTLGVGILAGIFVFAVAQLILMPAGIRLEQKELLIIAGGLLGIALLMSILMRVKKVNRGEKLADGLEKIANLLSK